jgi:hypothetical protein
MYTGFDEQGLADRAFQLGASAFVEKSAPLPELVEALLAVSSRGERPDPVDESAAAGVDSLDRSVLAEHLERFREVFDEAAIGMATMTLSGHLVRSNQALADLVGRPMAELVGIRYDVLTDGEDVLSKPLQILAEGRPARAAHARHGPRLESPAALRLPPDAGRHGPTWGGGGTAAQRGTLPAARRGRPGLRDFHAHDRRGGGELERGRGADQGVHRCGDRRAAFPNLLPA